MAARRLLAAFALVSISLFSFGPLSAGAARSTYPVVFAHGMGGFDNLFGFDYWGDDFGQFVGDPCDAFLETLCNWDLDAGQKTFAAQVPAFQTSVVRGYDLANDIEGYMATVGASYVNIIGHSQGGLDARKAAYDLRARKGRQVVRVLMTVSTPHRGSPVAKKILDLGSATAVINFLASVYGNVVYQSGNDGYAGAKQLVHNDYSSTDGVTTGTKAFNTTYPNSSNVAYRYVSVVTAQNGVSVNPALLALKTLIDIDGNGYCIGDCDNDGAAGQGNGNKSDLDDDGLVGMNSQQNGYRLKYTECFACLDTLTTNSYTGNVTNVNEPSSLQMTSTSALLNQDHADVVGVGPDTFSEMEFYAAAIHYIASFD